MERHPNGFIHEILEMRSYAAAKALVDRSDSTGEKIPESAATMMVMEVQAEIMEQDSGRNEP